MLSKTESITIFRVFGMTRPGIKPWSPWPLANIILIRPNSFFFFYFICTNFLSCFVFLWLFCPLILKKFSFFHLVFSFNFFFVPINLFQSWCVSFSLYPCFFSVSFFILLWLLAHLSFISPEIYCFLSFFHSFFLSFLSIRLSIEFRANSFNAFFFIFVYLAIHFFFSLLIRFPLSLYSRLSLSLSLSLSLAINLSIYLSLSHTHILTHTLSLSLPASLALFTIFPSLFFLSFSSYIWLLFI